MDLLLRTLFKFEQITMLGEAGLLTGTILIDIKESLLYITLMHKHP